MLQKKKKKREMRRIVTDTQLQSSEEVNKK